jgi:hypothetical protein
MITKNTNGTNVQYNLLEKENLHQTVRFILSGSFSKTDTELISTFQRINECCPGLLVSILPQSEQSYIDSNDDLSISITSDYTHLNVSVSYCIQSRYVRFTFRWPLRVGPKYLSITHPFAVMLREAFEIDYGIRNAFELGNIPLQWCKRFSFTDR